MKLTITQFLNSDHGISRFTQAQLEHPDFDPELIRCHGYELLVEDECGRSVQRVWVGAYHVPFDHSLSSLAEVMSRKYPVSEVALRKVTQEAMREFGSLATAQGAFKEFFGVY